MPENVRLYQELFGDDRFFLVSNKGTFDEYKENIELIRSEVQAFMEDV